MQDLDLVFCYQLHVCLEALEHLECLRLVPEKEETPESCSIINKDTKVSVTFWRLNRHGTMEISMDEV